MEVGGVDGAGTVAEHARCGDRGDLPVADTDIAGHGLIGKDKGSSVDYQIEVAH